MHSKTNGCSTPCNTAQDVSSNALNNSDKEKLLPWLRYNHITHVHLTEIMRTSTAIKETAGNEIQI